MGSIRHKNVATLAKRILSDFPALATIAVHLRASFHKTGYNGAQCRNESVTGNFWTVVFVHRFSHWGFRLGHTHLSSWVVLRRAIAPWHQRLVCNRLTESLDDSDRTMQPDTGFMYLNLLVGLGEELGVMPLSCDWNHWGRREEKLQMWKPAGTAGGESV